MHVIIEWLTLFGEVSAIKFVRLEKHVENEHFNKDH